MTAKTPFNISITAQDLNNNTVNFTNLVAMTETGDGIGGTVSPTNSSYFTAGVLASQSVTLSKAGAAVTLTVIGTNSGTIYTSVSDPFTVNPASPDLNWVTPTNIVYGTALGTNQNSATSSLTGTYVYNPTNGTVLPTGTNTLSVNFTPTDLNYSNRTLMVQLVVSPAVLGITANNTNRVYGMTNPGFTYTASGFVNGDTTNVLSGAPSLTTSAVTNSPAGSYIITNTAGTLSATNYSFIFTNGTLTVNQAGTTIALSSSSQTNGYKNSVNFTATLPSAATGSVIFKTNSVVLCTSNLVSGIAYSLSTTSLPRGTNLIMAEYTGDSNYLGSTNSIYQMVTNHPPAVVEAYYVRSAGLRLRMFWSELATNWSDLDNDSITNTGINLTTTNGVLLTTNSLQILYPNTAPNVNDRFSYTVTDSFGGSSVGYVNIVVNPFVTGQQITNSPSNPNSVTYFGHPGYTYLLQRSTNLTAGLGWVSIRTNTINNTGRTNIVDNFSDLGVTPSQAYYRVGWKPAY